jgi:hypothetical protein
MIRTRLGTLLGTLALACAASWFFSSFDRVTVDTYVGYRGEARRNPYLAAERLFTRMGARTNELRSVRELKSLPPGGVLVLPAQRVPLGPQQIDAVLVWVERGGRLVVESNEAREHDALLARLGVAREALRDGERRGGSCAASGPPYVRIPGRETPLLAELAQSARLRLPEHGVAWTADTSSGPQLAALDRGAGQVVVATSVRFLRNSAIGSHDHAEFAWIAAGEDATREIGIYNEPHRLSLLDWLLEHARGGLAGAALLLAVWLWRTVPRFGPLAREPAPGRRRLLEHLRAAGRHQWMSGDVSGLYAAAREACFTRVLRAHPEAAGLSADATARRLGTILDTPPADIESALAGQSLRNAHAFTRAVSTLQRLHSRLAARPAVSVRRTKRT